MSSKSAISVLPLKYWMIRHGLNLRDTLELKEIEPVFNRDGWYYNRHTKHCWFECRGKAFLYERANDFKYRVDLFTFKSLSEREVYIYTEMLKLQPSRDIMTPVIRALNSYRFMKNRISDEREVKKYILRFNKATGNNFPVY
jgi:hypothetical protein